MRPSSSTTRPYSSYSTSRYSEPRTAGPPRLTVRDGQAMGSFDPGQVAVLEDRAGTELQVVEQSHHPATSMQSRATTERVPHPLHRGAPAPDRLAEDVHDLELGACAVHPVQRRLLRARPWRRQVPEDTAVKAGHPMDPDAGPAREPPVRLDGNVDRSMLVGAGHGRVEAERRRFGVQDCGPRPLPPGEWPGVVDVDVWVHAHQLATPHQPLDVVLGEPRGPAQLPIRHDPVLVCQHARELVPVHDRETARTHLPRTRGAARLWTAAIVESDTRVVRAALHDL